MSNVGKFCLLVSVSFVAVGLVNSAVAMAAATAPAVTDPSSAWSAIQHYGVPWGSALVAFAVLAWFAKRNDESHWIHNWYGVTGLSGAVGVLGAVIDWKLNGGPPQSIAVALVSALLLILQKPKPGVTTSPNAQSGKFTPDMAMGLSLVATGVMLLALVLAGCGATTRQIGADSKACVVDVAKGLPASIESDVITWLTDTSLSDGDVTAKLEALGKGAAQTGLLGGEAAIVCIVQHAVADLQAKLAGAAGTAGAGFHEAVGVARGEAYLHSKGL